jgi:hypothetical protein
MKKHNQTIAGIHILCLLFGIIIKSIILKPYRQKIKTLHYPTRFLFFGKILDLEEKEDF